MKRNIKVILDKNSLMTIENVTLEEIELIWGIFIKGEHMFNWEWIRTDENKFANALYPKASYTMTIQWKLMDKDEQERRRIQIEKQL